MAIFINSQRLIQLCDYEQGKILEKVKLAKKKKKSLSKNSMSVKNIKA